MKELVQYDFTEVREGCFRWAVYTEKLDDHQLAKVIRFIMSNEFNDEILNLWKESDNKKQFEMKVTSLMLSLLLPKTYVN